MFEIPESVHRLIAIILALIFYTCFDLSDWPTDVRGGGKSFVWIGALLICFPRIFARFSELPATTPRFVRRLGWFALLITFFVGMLGNL
jgi:hypothetical protein